MAETPNEIRDCDDLIGILYSELGGSTSEPGTYVEDRDETKTDAEIIAIGSAATNGEKFRDLHAGNWLKYYTSQNEGDFAYVNMLSFYSGNKKQIARMFRAAPLGQRKKADREDYVNNMIEKSFDQQLPSLTFDHLFRPKPDEARFKLLNGTALANLPYVIWRIRNLLPAQGVASIYGASGSGKSFIALDQACAICEGRDWFGYKTKPTSVVYVVLEGESGFKARVRSLEMHLGHSVPPNLLFVVQSFNIAKDVEDLAAAVNPLGEGTVVYIDTLNRAAPGTDENSSKDMGAILENTKRLQSLTKGLVVLVHHTGKDSSKGMRGHSSLHAGMDAEIEVSREGEANDHSWKIAKAKDGLDGATLSFELKIIEVAKDEDGEPITSCVIVPTQAKPKAHSAKLTPAAQIALKSLGSCRADAVSPPQSLIDQLEKTHSNQFFPPLSVVRDVMWRERSYLQGISGGGQDAKRKAFNRAHDDLLEQGRVRTFDGLYWLPEWCVKLPTAS